MFSHCSSLTLGSVSIKAALVNATTMVSGIQVGICSMVSGIRVHLSQPEYSRAPGHPLFHAMLHNPSHSIHLFSFCPISLPSLLSSLMVFSSPQYKDLWTEVPHLIPWGHQSRPPKPWVLHSAPLPSQEKCCFSFSLFCTSRLYCPFSKVLPLIYLCFSTIFHLLP